MEFLDIYGKDFKEKYKKFEDVAQPQEREQEEYKEYIEDESDYKEFRELSDEYYDTSIQERDNNSIKFFNTTKGLNYFKDIVKEKTNYKLLYGGILYHKNQSVIEQLERAYILKVLNHLRDKYYYDGVFNSPTMSRFQTYTLYKIDNDYIVKTEESGELPIIDNYGKSFNSAELHKDLKEFLSKVKYCCTENGLERIK